MFICSAPGALLRLAACSASAAFLGWSLSATQYPQNHRARARHYCPPQYVEIHRAIPCDAREGRLGQQLSCDRGSAYSEDEELEDIGVSAVWFELVDDQEQHGGDEADRERIEESPHLRPTLIAASSDRIRWTAPPTGTSNSTEVQAL
jgi:hypothetical protein